MTTAFVSHRIPSNDQAFEAFTDRTYELLDQFTKQFEVTTRRPFDSQNFIILASDFLIHQHGERASWQLFDAEVFEAFFLAAMPPLKQVRIAIAATLAIFFRFLAAQNIVPNDVAHRVEHHARKLLRKHAS